MVIISITVEATLFAAIDAQNVSSVRYLLKKGCAKPEVIDVSYENDTAIYLSIKTCA